MTAGWSWCRFRPAGPGFTVVSGIRLNAVETRLVT
jgi:hypothetical protein